VCIRDKGKKRVKVSECIESRYNRKKWKVGSEWICDNKDDGEIMTEMTNELREKEDRQERFREKVEGNNEWERWRRYDRVMSRMIEREWNVSD